MLLGCCPPVPQGPVPPPWRASLAEPERSALASIITQLAARAQFSKDPSGWWVGRDMGQSACHCRRAQTDLGQPLDCGPTNTDCTWAMDNLS
jgi:hypothetical protein